MEWQIVVAKFLETLLLGLAPVLAAAVTGWVAVKIRVALEELKNEYKEQWWILELVATTAVQAAEQANLAGLIKDKKAYALSIVEAALAEHGFAIDLDVIDAAVEAAVWSEFNKPGGGG